MENHHPGNDFPEEAASLLQGLAFTSGGWRCRLS